MQKSKTIVIWKMVIAIVISWQLAKSIGFGHPYLAPITVILSLQATINQSIRYSFHRIIGTAIGVAVTSFIASYLEVNALTLGMLILVGSYIVKWLNFDEKVINQVALTILLVFVFEHKTTNYALDRIFDTTIGALTAIVIHTIIFPPNSTKEATNGINQFASHLSEAFLRTGEWIKNGCNTLEGNRLNGEAKLLLEELFQVNNEIKNAFKSLKFNPLSQGDKQILMTYQNRIIQLTEGVIYLKIAIRTFANWSRNGIMSEMDASSWYQQMKVFHSLYQGKGRIERTNGELFLVTHGTNNVFEPMQVYLPIGIEKQSYHASIYIETKLLLQDLGLI